MAKRNTKGGTALVGELVPTDNPEIALTVSEGGVIETFIQGLAPFFGRARELEARAESALEEAKTWAMPTDGSADADLVSKVRVVNAAKKELADHWEITAVVHRFQRRLTAARDRAINHLEEASRIGNQLHNAYGEAERRRAREEEERLRREAEERARKDREAELARLEAEALAREEASPDLSDRERMFVDYYTGPQPNPARAAAMAGYKHADTMAAKLLSQDKILKAIEIAREAKLLREQATAKRQSPVDVEHETVKADVAKGSASRWSAEVFDGEAFMAALLDPVTRTRLGIPSDIATYKPVALNDYARALGEQIDRWPGVRAVKKTSIR